MSYCKKEGKDIIMFITEEDHKAPSKYTLPDETEAEPGLILPNGDINWNCPCLGGMSSGPCGYEFRSAFSCFHYSKEEPKGSECFDEFRRMTECMAQYPKLYDADSDDPVDLAAIDDEESKGGKADLDLDAGKSPDPAPTDSISKRPS